VKPTTHDRITVHAVSIAMRYADAREVEEALRESYEAAKRDRESIEAEWRAMTAPDWKGKP
jgi:hypothetical protein